MTTLNITIGPVQGFVVQARRTRDLWSGSFLLSYLSGCAMLGAIDAGGNIVEPDITGDRLIKRIREKEGSNIDIENLIGSMPNRFKIECENPEKVAHGAKKAFDEAWNKIAGAVWDGYLKDANIGNGTRTIWERQVNNFWEFSWTVGDQKTLDGRKNWRRQDIPEEGGDHCTLMGDRQELSGFIRFKQRDKQDEFWEQVRKGTEILGLQEDERLCAIAFIKRFFPKVAMQAIGVDISTLHWPSTVYMAAVPWLKNLDEKEKEKLDHHYGMARKCGDGVLRPQIPKMLGLDDLGKKAQLDGNFYFKDLIMNKDATPLNEPCEDLRAELVKSLGQVDSLPSVYYALLLMDGDNLGKMKKDNPTKTRDISKALSDFSKQVPKTVRKHNGITIYAGGDDVLAMLPMDTALSCARKLSEIYGSSFNNVEIKENHMKTISAGLVYSHYHQPLQSVYHEAHHLLDDIAKDKNHRNSIAVSVLKGSGKYLQWVTKWEDMPTFSEALKQCCDEKIFSSSLLFSVRESLSRLTDIHNWQPGQEMEIKQFDSELNLESLIVADILRSREGKIDRETAEKKLKPILDTCYRDNKSKFLIDGWFLARFLSSKGVST